MPAGCLAPPSPADYVLLCVDAVSGATRITREHLAVAVALEVPTALVITKVDAVEPEQLQQVCVFGEWWCSQCCL